MRRETAWKVFCIVSVSILTRLGGRVRPLVASVLNMRLQVSILTRLGGRVRRYKVAVSRRPVQFQSSPGLEAGCDRVSAIDYTPI